MNTKSTTTERIEPYAPLPPRDLAVDRPLPTAKPTPFGSAEGDRVLLKGLLDVVKEPPLNRIADQVLLLSYGDMKEFADGLMAARGEGNGPLDLSKTAIADMVHDWAKAQVAKDNAQGHHE